MTANVPVKLLFEVNNNIFSGDKSAKKGTQLSLIEESYIIKAFEKQLRPRRAVDLSPRYGHVRLVSRYLLLTGVNSDAHR